MARRSLLGRRRTTRAGEADDSATWHDLRVCDLGAKNALTAVLARLISPRYAIFVNELDNSNVGSRIHQSFRERQGVCSDASNGAGRTEHAMLDCSARHSP